MHTLSQDMAVQIQAVRDALKQFDFAYWNVWFPGGTGSSHQPIRSYPYREDFFAELIGSIMEDREPEVSEEEILLAWGILDDLSTITERAMSFCDDDSEFWSEGSFSSYPDDLRNAIETLRDSINALPEWVQVELAQFIDMTYPEWGPYIVDQDNDP